MLDRSESIDGLKASCQRQKRDGNNWTFHALRGNDRTRKVRNSYASPVPPILLRHYYIMHTQRSRYKDLTPEEATYCKRQMLRNVKAFGELINHVTTNGYVKIRIPKYLWYVEPWKI